MYNLKTIWKESDLEEISIDYQGVIANAVEGLFITTVDGKYLMVNNALAEIYGYDSVQHLMDSITNIGEQLYVDKSMREVFVNLMNKNDRLVNFEAEIYTRSGERKWIRENVRSVKDENGEVQYYEGFVSDISELKQNKRVIKSKNKELSELNRSLEEKVEERTAELELQRQIVHVQNERLAKLLHQVTQIKITRQATMIAIAITLALFMVTEVLVEPIIEGNYKNDFYISLGLKALIALLIKPIEMVVESILIRTRSKKLIANKVKSSQEKPE